MQRALTFFPELYVTTGNVPKLIQVKKVEIDLAETSGLYLQQIRQEML